MDIDKVTNTFSGMPDWFYDLLAYVTPAIAALLLLGSLGIDVYASFNEMISNQYIAAAVLLVMLYIYGQLTSTYSHSMKYAPHRIYILINKLCVLLLKYLERAKQKHPSSKDLKFYSYLVSKCLSIPDPIIGSYPSCKPPQFLGYDEDGNYIDNKEGVDIQSWSALSGTNRRMLLISYFRIVRPSIANDILKTYARIKISRAVLWNSVLFTILACILKFSDTDHRTLISESNAILLGIILAVIFSIDFISRERWLSGTLSSAVDAENQYFKLRSGAEDK